MDKTILFVENSIGFGGSIISLVDTFPFFMMSGFRIVLVTSRTEKPFKKLANTYAWVYIPDKCFNKNELRKQLIKYTGREIKIVDAVLSLADYLLNVLPYALRLSVIAKKNRASLLYLNNDPISNLGGIIVALLFRIPAICHVRGYVFDSRLSRFSLRCIKRFIAVSSDVKKSLLRLGARPEIIDIVYEGVNIKKMNNISNCENNVEREFNLQANDICIGVVGLIMPWKGQKTFIEAAKNVLKKYENCKFFIIGGVPSNSVAYAQDLKNLVDELDIAKNVIFTGYREDVYCLMARMDIIVHTAIEPEPFGRVIIEAMALKKPVIATAVGGPVEIITDSSFGILIKPNSPGKLADEICRLVSEPETRQNLGDNAYKVVLNNYQLGKQGTRVVKICEEVLSSINQGGCN